MQNIYPCLWFNFNAVEAINFYLSIFKDARIVEVVRYGEAGPGPKDSVMTILFELNGSQFLALNGGPQFKFTEALSLVVNCKTQEEVDYYWNKLTEGGEEGQCGWLKDKFGLSWQIVPEALIEIIKEKNSNNVKRVTEALYKMKKIDMKVLKEAYDEKLNK